MYSHFLTFCCVLQTLSLHSPSLALRNDKLNYGISKLASTRIQQTGFISPGRKSNSFVTRNVFDRGFQSRKSAVLDSSKPFRNNPTECLAFPKNSSAEPQPVIPRKRLPKTISRKTRIVALFSFLTVIFLSSHPANASLALVSNVSSAANRFYVTMPYTSSFVTCGLKGSIADFLAQIKGLNDNAGDERRRRAISLKRNIAYVLYGGLYLGCVLHYVYGVVYPKLFGSGMKLSTVMSQVLFDNFVMSPLLSFPLAYVVKSIICGNTITNGISKYVKDVRDNRLLLKAWAIWLPVQSITFSVVPEHLRIAFMAFVSFFWLVLLSSVEAKENNV